MKLSEWINSKIESNTSKIKILKKDVKKIKGKDHSDVSKKNKLSQEVHHLELLNKKLKGLAKAKLVRLAPSTVVNISVLDAMLKKLKGAHTRLIIRNDELVLEYAFHKDHHGKLTINKNGTGVQTINGVEETKIPDEVIVPQFDASEVEVHDITDERF